MHPSISELASSAGGARPLGARRHARPFRALLLAMALGATGARADDLSAWETQEYLRAGTLAQIDAAAAYAQGYTGAGVKVGVADTGLWTTHPEFSGRVLPGFNFLSGQALSPDQPTDPAGHGTHVSGIIAAARDGVEMHGVAFNALLVPTAMSLVNFVTDDNASNPWPFLISQGVSVINASYGLQHTDVTALTRAQFEAKYPIVMQRALQTAAADVLMVVAAGNDATANPELLAGLPHLVPELQNSWLAVVSLDPANMIAESSDRCGVAKAWCLAAPGDVVYSTWREDGYEVEGGTSMAAPVVTGTAALVKEAFPWFTAHDLQQALLTTATDIGTPGVDDIYGWGLVNAGRAVRGYGQFTSITTLDTQGYTSTFSNDISGDGGLVKTGDGTLILAGHNTYAGGSVVAGGTLAITGSVSSTVVVNAAGTLSGTGTIAAPLVVAGRLAPGLDGGGALTVEGPVGFAPSATFAPVIARTTDTARLVASGGVSLAGTLAPILETGTAPPALGETFTVLSARQGLMGAFDAVAQPEALSAGTRFDTLYGPHTVAVLVTPQSYGHLSANGLFTTVNATATGAALDSIRPTAGTAPEGLSGSLFTGLYSLAPAALPATLAQLSGEIHASAAAMVFDDARQVRSAISSRLDDRARSAEADAARPLATGWNVMAWVTGYGAWAAGSGGAAARFDWTQGGALAGADVAVTQDTRIGIAGGMGHSSGNMDALASSAANDHVDAALYGTTRVGALALRYAAAYGWNDISTRRSITPAPLAQTLISDAGGSTVQVFGEAGYRLDFGAARTEPFAALAYIRQAFDPFSETGGSAALVGRTSNLDVTLVTLGARLSMDIPWGGGVLTPRLTAGWQHAAGDVATQAVMHVGGSLPFEVSGVPLARDALALDASLSYRVSDSLSATLAYEGILADDTQSSTLKGMLRAAF